MFCAFIRIVLDVIPYRRSVVNTIHNACTLQLLVHFCIYAVYNISQFSASDFLAILFLWCSYGAMTHVHSSKTPVDADEAQNAPSKILRATTTTIKNTFENISRKLKSSPSSQKWCTIFPIVRGRKITAECPALSLI